MRKIGIINFIEFELDSFCYLKMYSYKSGIVNGEDLFIIYGII